MTKDVIVTINGLQFAQETETEPVEIVTAGSYYKKNGKHYIIYDEVMEGFEGSTKNIIKLTEDSLDVTKKGVSIWCLKKIRKISLITIRRLETCLSALMRKKYR